MKNDKKRIKKENGSPEVYRVCNVDHMWHIYLLGFGAPDIREKVFHNEHCFLKDKTIVGLYKQNMIGAQHSQLGSNGDSGNTYLTETRGTHPTVPFPLFTLAAYNIPTKHIQELQEFDRFDKPRAAGQDLSCVLCVGDPDDCVWSGESRYLESSNTR